MPMNYIILTSNITEIAANQMKGADITAADEEGYMALLLAALESHLTCLSSQHEGHNS